MQLEQGAWAEKDNIGGKPALVNETVVTNFACFYFYKDF